VCKKVSVCVRDTECVSENECMCVCERERCVSMEILMAASNVLEKGVCECVCVCVCMCVCVCACV